MSVADGTVNGKRFANVFGVAPGERWGQWRDPEQQIALMRPSPQWEAHERRIAGIPPRMSGKQAAFIAQAIRDQPDLFVPVLVEVLAEAIGRIAAKAVRALIANDAMEGARGYARR